MVKRRVIRVGVTFNRTHYFIDKGQQRGAGLRVEQAFEDDLNADLKTGNLEVHVARPAVTRSAGLGPADGKVDLVVAMLTVTPELPAIAVFRTDAHQRERSRGDRPWRAADRDARRPAGQECSSARQSP